MGKYELADKTKIRPGDSALRRIKALKTIGSLSRKVYLGESGGVGGTRKEPCTYWRCQGWR